MDETSREETDDQIDEDYSPIPEETQLLASSSLIFATFVEPGSSGMPGIESKAKLEPHLFYPNIVAPPCRIALKRDPLNPDQYVWTYVPQAKGDGSEPTMWPQEVIVLGKPVVVSQAVWDTYKCDPEYECYISPFPGQPTVSRRANLPPSGPSTERAGTPLATKRTGSDLGDSTDASPRKKQKTAPQTESYDEDIQEMPHHTAAARVKLRREKERRERTQHPTRRESFRMSNMANDLPTVNQGGVVDDTPTPPKPSTTKEKFSMETDPIQIKRGRQSWEFDPTFRSSKRAKTYQSEDDYFKPSRPGRGSTFASRRTRAPVAGQKAKERDFWQGVDFSQFKGVKISLEQESEEPKTEPAVREETPQRSSTPQAQPEHASTRRSPPIFVDSDDDSDEDANGNSEYATPGGGSWQNDWEGLQDSEDERERRLYASRKKMEELNDAERRVREERRRREQESEARMREYRRQEQQRQRAEKLRQQSVEEEEQRKKEEKENRRREPPRETWHQTNAPWSDSHFSSGSGRSNGFNFDWFNSYAPFGSRGSTFGSYQPRPAPAASSSVHQWTPQNALDRYNRLSESFDAFKGTSTVPVPPLDQIPWPVLFKPGFSIESVDWESVEKFFEAAERLTVIRPNGREKWKEFLKTSTRRFHPDRWRARGIIGEKGYGIDIEEKVNHVSKVLTPLYRNAN